jgi:hypothetical protein
MTAKELDVDRLARAVRNRMDIAPWRPSQVSFGGVDVLTYADAIAAEYAALSAATPFDPDPLRPDTDDEPWTPPPETMTPEHRAWLARWFGWHAKPVPMFAFPEMDHPIPDPEPPVEARGRSPGRWTFVAVVAAPFVAGYVAWKLLSWRKR